MREPRNPERRTLVVDDCEPFLQSLQRFLARHLRDVDTATTVVDACARLADAQTAGRPYELVVLALFLGAESGELVLDFIDGLAPRPAVVMLSGGDFEANHMLRLHERCVFLRKSDDFAVILDGLQRAACPVSRFAKKHRFTAQQRTILDATIAGFRNRGIAAALDVGYGTLRTHWDRIGTKVGRRGRAEVLAELIRSLTGARSPWKS